MSRIELPIHVKSMLSPDVLSLLEDLIIFIASPETQLDFLCRATAVHDARQDYLNEVKVDSVVATAARTKVWNILKRCKVNMPNTVDDDLPALSREVIEEVLRQQPDALRLAAFILMAYDDRTRLASTSFVRKMRDDEFLADEVNAVIGEACEFATERNEDRLADAIRRSRRGFGDEVRMSA